MGHPPEEGDFGLNSAGHGADGRPPAGQVEKVGFKKSGLEKKALLLLVLFSRSIIIDRPF